MLISHLKKIIVVSVVLLCTAITLLYQENLQRYNSLQGNSLFKLSTGIEGINKVEIQFADNQITLYQDEDMWRVQEVDNYYADFKMIHRLLEEMQSSKKGNEVQLDNDDSQEWVTIKLFDKQDKLLESVMLNNPSQTETHHTKSQDNSKINRTTWGINIPNDAISWVHKPLINFDPNKVSSLIKNDFEIKRNDIGHIFIDSQNNLPYRDYKYLNIFDVLTELWSEKVLSSQEYNQELYPYIQKLTVTTFAGLITEIKIYTDFKEYWVQIDIKTNKLPTQQIKDYVANNKYLYTDWWFKLPPDKGRELFLFSF